MTLSESKWAQMTLGKFKWYRMSQHEPKPTQNFVNFCQWYMSVQDICYNFKAL